MNRIIYWSIMAGAALMAGTLMALPLWDYYHYGHPTAAGFPTSPTTLAVMTGAAVPPSSYPPAGPAARSRPPGETVPVPSPVPNPGPGDRPGDGPGRLPGPTPNMAQPGNPPTAPTAAHLHRPAAA